MVRLISSAALQLRERLDEGCAFFLAYKIKKPSLFMSVKAMLMSDASGIVLIRCDNFLEEILTRL